MGQSSNGRIARNFTGKHCRRTSQRRLCDAPILHVEVKIKRWKNIWNTTSNHKKAKVPILILNKIEVERKNIYREK